MLNSRIVLISICLYLSLTARPNVKITSNYNASLIHQYASIATKLDVHISGTRLQQPNYISGTPINQKYSYGLYQSTRPNLDIAGLHQKMVHIDFQMIYEPQPPNSIFEDRYSEQYHLLQSRQFHITMANPSQVFSLCVNEIFSDCENIKKLSKKTLPICMNPFTKYPFYFNLYVTQLKNRQIIKPSIYFNVTFYYQNHQIINKLWLRQLKFTLLPNHLKLTPIQIRNCEHQHTIVNIKNPQKYDLSMMLIHKYKKLHTNGQPLDDKFTISAHKNFKFLLEAKDSTMTVYSKPIDGGDKIYPVLYVPVYCYDRLVIQSLNLGIISSNRLALIYPIFVTSNTNSIVNIQQIQLISTRNTVEVNRLANHKTQIPSLQRYVQVGIFTVYSAKIPSIKNSITIKIKYSLGDSLNASSFYQTKRIFTYMEQYNVIEVGNNRYYELSNLPPQKQYNQSQKIRFFNYSVTNKMNIPIRMQRITFDSKNFKMHWYRYSGQYIYPNQTKQQILLEYIGPRQISISPLKKAACIQFSGNILVPFQTYIYDRSLVCIYQGKQTRCSLLKFINFGYQKSNIKIQNHTIIFRNFNPHNITIQINNIKNLNETHNIDIFLIVSQPFPYYENYLIKNKDKTIINLYQGHKINLTIIMRIYGIPISGQVMLQGSTQYEKFLWRIKFNFEQGRLLFSPSIYQIGQFDRQHRGQLQLISTYQDTYQIRQIISNTNLLQFVFNESQEYEINQKVVIPFIYNPHRDEYNITSQCCTYLFLKNYYLNSLIYFDENSIKNYDVIAITNTDSQQKLNIKVDIRKGNLLHKYDRKIELIGLKVGNNTRVCLQIYNPYSSTLKYNIFFIPNAVIYKHKDYLDYFKHSRKQKTDAFICLNLKKSNYLINSIKSMFRLDDNPIKIQFNKDQMGNIDYQGYQKDNLSYNQYLNTIIQTGQQNCFKVNTFIYFKLLIQSQVINSLLQYHSLQLIQKFIEKQWEHMNNNSVSFINDLFYHQIKIKLQDYCYSTVFPIFRFCLHFPIHIETGQNKLSPYYLQSNKSNNLCLILNNNFSSKNETSFEMVIINNYSKYDEYKIDLAMMEAKINVGNIAFELNQNINHQIFMKHYFSAIYRSSNQLLQQSGISNRNKIIPIYLTNQDYKEQFKLFSGQRYFQIENSSPMNIEFSHFGYDNKQNIMGSGIQIQRLGQNGHIVLNKNMKTQFKLNFIINEYNEFNISNIYYHKKINIYLYNNQQYYLSLILLIKIADNVLPKIKVYQQIQYKQQNKLGYILLNLISFTYICIVIINFQKEQKEKMNKMKIAIQKKSKIIPLKKEIKQQNIGFIEQKYKNIQLLPQSIGNKIKINQQNKLIPYYIIHQQELLFFKSIKIQKDKSIASQSSDQPILKFNNQEIQKDHHQSEQYNQQQQSKNQSSNDPFQNASDIQSEQSLLSLSQSVLPDGISVCNQQLETLDQDFQFGFENSKKLQKQKIKQDYIYYDVFSNHNPLKKQKKEKIQGKENPFPWMNQNDKKKTRSKKIKRQKQQISNE